MFSPGSRESLKDDYDLTHSRHTPENVSVTGGVLALVKGCLGGGMLAMHEAYKHCGLWTALALNILIGAAMTYSMYELARAAQKLYAHNSSSSLAYVDLIEATFEFSDCRYLQDNSRKIRHVVEIFICILLFSACAAYQVMIARAIKQIAEGLGSLPSSDEYLTYERIYTASLLVPCTILGVFVTIKNLAPFSIVLDFFVVMIAVTTVYYGAKASSGSPLDLPAFGSIAGMCEFIGITLFSMDGCGVILAVENSLKNPKDLPLVLLGGMPIVTLIVIVIGSFGYWGFGDKSVTPITINFPWNALPYTIKFFLCMMVYVTFGLTFWQPSNIVWHYISYYYDEDRFWIWEKFYRMLMVLLTTLVAVALPDVTRFMGLIGTFCVSLLSLVLPNLISLLMDWKDPGLGRYNWRMWKTLFAVLLSLVIMTLGTIVNGVELVQNLQYRLRAP